VNAPGSDGELDPDVLQAGRDLRRADAASGVQVSEAALERARRLLLQSGTEEVRGAS
jgi:hypothetical protein